VECELEHDTTGGLNQDGEVVLHVPNGHSASGLSGFDGSPAGWLRARVITPDPDVPSYRASPNIKAVEAFTIGGTVAAINADEVEAEMLGTSDGTAGQHFSLGRRPVVPSTKPAVLEVSGDAGWQEWTEVADFAGSGPADRHFVITASAGEVLLGPAVRMPDGTLRQYGEVPEKGAQLRIRSYRTGGGQRGNVARGVVTVLKSSIPYVTRVVNRRQGLGGVDGESIENAKARGPLMLRTLSRAVTPEDYEHLAREAAPEVARVRCVPAGDGVDAGAVRVLVVPAVASENGQLRFEQLVPAEQTLARISERLDECRLIGSRVLVEPPLYRGVTIVARLRARPRSDPHRLEAEALRRLYSYFHPTTGGPDGDGWPFGRSVVAGEVHSVLQELAGTDVVDDVRLFGADPLTGQRGAAVQRLELEPHALVFPYEHQVLIEGS
jgi:predicted phage baseplate assembly protein